MNEEEFEESISSIEDYLDECTNDQLDKIYMIVETFHTNARVNAMKKNSILDSTPQKAVKAVPVAFPTGIWMDATPFEVLPPQKKQETETTMRTEIQETKDYLIRSLDAEINRKDRDLVAQFNLRPLYPKNGKELKEFVEKGFVVVDDNIKDDFDFDWHSPNNFLHFSDPERKPDQEGYDKAIKEVRKAASDVKDAIIVLGAEKGLEKLNEFKAS